MNSSEYVLMRTDPDFQYDENQVYARYVVQREFGFWSVVRKNLITEQGWHVAKYTDEQTANHIAFTLNQVVQVEAK